MSIRENDDSDPFEASAFNFRCAPLNFNAATHSPHNGSANHESRYEDTNLNTYADLEQIKLSEYNKRSVNELAKLQMQMYGDLTTGIGASVFQEFLTPDERQGWYSNVSDSESDEDDEDYEDSESFYDDDFDIDSYRPCKKPKLSIGDLSRTPPITTGEVPDINLRAGDNSEENPVDCHNTDMDTFSEDVLCTQATSLANHDDQNTGDQVSPLTLSVLSNLYTTLCTKLDHRLTSNPLYYLTASLPSEATSFMHRHIEHEIQGRFLSLSQDINKSQNKNTFQMESLMVTTESAVFNPATIFLREPLHYVSYDTFTTPRYVTYLTFSLTREPTQHDWSCAVPKFWYTNQHVDRVASKVYNSEEWESISVPYKLIEY